MYICIHAHNFLIYFLHVDQLYVCMYNSNEYAILNVCMYASIYALQELIREVEATRLKLAQDFYARLKKNKSIVAALKPRRVALRDGYDSDDDRNYKIEIIVSVIKYSLSLYLLQ